MFLTKIFLKSFIHFQSFRLLKTDIGLDFIIFKNFMIKR